MAARPRSASSSKVARPAPAASQPKKKAPRKAAAAPTPAPKRAPVAKPARRGPTSGSSAKPAPVAPSPAPWTPAPSPREARVGSRPPSQRAPKTGPGPVLTSRSTEPGHEAAMAAATRWALVTARDLMRENVVTVSKDTPLSELVRIFSDQKISGAPVTDETGQIVGVVSMRDLIDQYSEDDDGKPRHGNDWFSLTSEEYLEQDYESFEVPEESEETVVDIMTAEVVSVPEEAGLRAIAAKMIERKVHRVLVERTGDPGVYIGILGTFEILDMLTE